MKIKGIITRQTKLFVTVMILLGILIVLTPLYLYGYYKYKVYAFKKETYDYLYSKRYQDIEIKKVEVVNVKGILLSLLVEFIDEPNDDEIKFKHSE